MADEKQTNADSSFSRREFLVASRAITAVSTLGVVVPIPNIPLGREPIAQFCREPRYDLNGLRIKSRNRPEIYLVMSGYRRWIPDPATYNNLFRNWEGVVPFADIDAIPLGAPITPGAVL